MALESLFVGLGLASLFVDRMATESSGAASFNAQTFSELVVTTSAPFPLLGDETSIRPALGWTPWGRASPDGGTSTSIWRLSAPVEKAYGPLSLCFGPGIVAYHVTGNGGTTTLNNGTSTKGFAFPLGSSFSTTFAIEAGLGFQHKRVRLDADAWIVDVLSARRRALNYTLTASFEVL